MRTYLARVMEGPGSPLATIERELPTPGPHDVVVRVAASSLNYHDVVTLMGFIDGPWPRSPMSDGAGEVVAIGEEVTEWQVGDRVISSFYPDWRDGSPTPATKRTVPGDTIDGWLQQYRVPPAATLTRAPDHLSDVEAACLVCAGTTAWSSLAVAGVGPGDTVVTLGTGGVSLFVVQFAKALGATVIVTSSSPEKLEIGRSLGADHGVDYCARPDWHQEIRRLTDRRGADVVVDLGGAATLARSVRATRMAGTVVVAGVLGGAGDAEIPVSSVMTRNLRLNGVTVGSVEAHRAMAAFVSEHRIVPHISHLVAWDEIDEAMRVMQGNEHVGKIGITIPPPLS